MILEETYELANGIRIPKLGFGTWLIEGPAAERATKDAIAIGYRFIDTAQAYGNEAEVGKAVREFGVPREKLFVASKIAAELKDEKAAAASIDETLRKMGLDYLDQMIIHAPQPWAEFRDTDDHFYEGNLAAWAALEKAHDEGKVRVIGVSNFKQDDLKNIQDNGRIAPMVNQILCHVGQVPQDMVDYCRESNILVEAYSPIAHGEAHRLQGVAALADKYGVSVAQLCLRFLIQLGMAPLPKATSEDHIRANAELDFEIDPDDMAALMATAPLSDYGEQDFFPVFNKARA